MFYTCSMERVVRHLKDHFIPHEGNGHHPHVLRHRVLAGYSVLLVLVKIAAVMAPVLLPSSSVFSSSITEGNIIALTNETRAAEHLPLLHEDAHLREAARLKAEDMLAKQYFAHASPSGQNALDLIKASGYAPLYAGENLAVHYLSAEQVNDGWMLSPTHRANILNPRYADIGVGIVNGDFEGQATTFVVQLFGKPVVADAPAAPVEPEAPASPITATLAPSPTGLKITVSKPAAKHVSVQLAHAQADLAPFAETSGTFAGQIALEKGTVSEAGDTVVAAVSDADGGLHQEPVAIVTPEVPVQKIYAFHAQEPKITVFGKVIEGLGDHVRLFYVSFMAFIIGSLLISLAYKASRTRRLPVGAHAMGVLALALMLYAV